MRSSGEGHAWEPGGSASVPPPAVDLLSVPGELFHPSTDHKLSWPGQGIRVHDLSRHPEQPSYWVAMCYTALRYAVICCCCMHHLVDYLTCHFRKVWAKPGRIVHGMCLSCGFFYDAVSAFRFSKSPRKDIRPAKKKSQTSARKLLYGREIRNLNSRFLSLLTCIFLMTLSTKGLFCLSGVSQN